MAHEVEILFGLQNEWHASETNLMFQEVCIYISQTFYNRYVLGMYKMQSNTKSMWKQTLFLIGLNYNCQLFR